FINGFPAPPANLKCACIGLCLDKCCPEGWTQSGSRFFIFFYNSKTWINTELSCIEIGGNLASIHSSDDSRFILGGHDGVQEGVWQWTDGSPFDFKSWGYGAPNNYTGENCLSVNWGANLWNDYRCYYRLPYMCSIRPVPRTRSGH
uniref:C-type lectin domain-containing protein n=1 Tax=Periophthalmus magnuspinnatus TaxID=409849 RepID=A0A3B4A2G7_9GOBI